MHGAVSHCPDRASMIGWFRIHFAVASVRGSLSTDESSHVYHPPVPVRFTETFMRQREIDVAPSSHIVATPSSFGWNVLSCVCHARTVTNPSSGHEWMTVLVLAYGVGESMRKPLRQGDCDGKEWARYFDCD